MIPQIIVSIFYEKQKKVENVIVQTRTNIVKYEKKEISPLLGLGGSKIPLNSLSKEVVMRN